MEEGSTWNFNQQSGNLLVGRNDPRMVELDGTIYAMSGWNHWSNEKFTPYTWSFIADQYSQQQIAMQCLAVDEQTKLIYQLGGYVSG